MNQQLDSDRYPRAASYIAELPDGLASYPDCLVLAHVHRFVQSDFPQLAKGQVLPPALEAFFEGQSRELWFPEVVGNAIYLMIRDTACPTDEQFLVWNGKNIERLMGNPFYRGLMGLMSPALLVKSTAKRWSSFHHGSTMSEAKIGTTSGRTEAHIMLTTPERLFTPLMLRQHCSTFQTVLALAHAQHPEVSVKQARANVIEFLAAWDS